jgi:hypothetical protein
MYDRVGCVGQKSHIDNLRAQQMQGEMSAGHIYAVMSGSNRSGVKCGYTTHVCPEHYLHTQYARMMQPLTIIKIMHLPDALLGEKMLFRCLARFRSCCKHEVFNVTSLQDVLVAFNAVKSGFEAMAECDPSAAMTEVTVPSRGEYLDTQCQKRIVKGIVARIVKKVLKEQERLERIENQMRGRVKRQGARKIQRAEEDEKVSSDLADWLEKHCQITRNRRDRIQSSRLYDRYSSDMSGGSAMERKRFHKIVQQKGAWRSDTSGITYYRGIVLRLQEGRSLEKNDVGGAVRTEQS